MGRTHTKWCARRPDLPETVIPEVSFRFRPSAGSRRQVIGETSLSGSDEEDDGSLRARYFETFDVQAFGGNIISYRTAILAVSGVGAVQVYPAWKGGGTVLCSILNSQMKPAG